jgi:hypothetical protein
MTPTIHRRRQFNAALGLHQYRWAVAFANETKQETTYTSPPLEVGPGASFVLDLTVPELVDGTTLDVEMQTGPTDQGPWSRLGSPFGTVTTAPSAQCQAFAGSHAFVRVVGTVANSAGASPSVTFKLDGTMTAPTAD